MELLDTASTCFAPNSSECAQRFAGPMAKGVWRQGHDRFQHLAVFWAAPLGGALAAGLTWSALAAPSRESRPPAVADARDAKKEL